MIVLAKFLHMGGVIHCHGALLGHRCAKIRRDCRSSLSSECHDAVTAGDHALWFQMVMIELATHRYDIRKLVPRATGPLVFPLADAPSNIELEMGNYIPPILKIGYYDR